MSSKARELSKFSFDIHVNEGAGTLGIGTTADVMIDYTLRVC